MNKTYPLKWVNLTFRILLLTLVIVALLAGCTHVPRDGDFTEVKRLVGERIPQKVHWYQGEDEDAQLQAVLNNLLQEPLTARSAVQIALLNNQRLCGKSALRVATPMPPLAIRLTSSLVTTPPRTTKLPDNFELVVRQ